MPRKVCKPDPDVLRHECEVLHVPIEGLTRQYGYGSVSNLYSWCRRWGIRPYRHPRPTDHLRLLDLTPQQHQIVLGSLLGDASIRRGRNKSERSKNCVLVLGHGEKQRDYLDWQKQQLEPFILGDQPRMYVQSGFSAGSKLYSYTSIRHPAFTAYRQLFYPDGIKHISQPVLDGLEPLGIAFWLMDDGSYHQGRGYIYLSTNAYPREELELAADWFACRFGIKPLIHSAGRLGQFQLAFNRRSALTLRDMVCPYFFEKLLYKIGC